MPKSRTKDHREKVGTILCKQFTFIKREAHCKVKNPAFGEWNLFDLHEKTNDPSRVYLNNLA
jgi:hypothetical protein